MKEPFDGSFLQWKFRILKRFFCAIFFSLGERKFHSSESIIKLNGQSESTRWKQHVWPLLNENKAHWILILQLYVAVVCCTDSFFLSHVVVLTQFSLGYPKSFVEGEKEKCRGFWSCFLSFGLSEPPLMYWSFDDDIAFQFIFPSNSQGNFTCGFSLCEPNCRHTHNHFGKRFPEDSSCLRGNFPSGSVLVRWIFLSMWLWLFTCSENFYF